MMNDVKFDVESNSKPCILQVLPHEVLIHVLSKLNAEDLVRVSAVCKTFHGIIQTPEYDERYFLHVSSDSNIFACFGTNI
jgi:hypothetical protein